MSQTIEALLPSELASPPSLLRVRRDGVEVAVVCSQEGLPEIVHWGADLGDVDEQELRFATARGISPSGLDEAWPLTILPGEHDGWAGRPGLMAHRDGAAILPRWTTTLVTSEPGHLQFVSVSSGLLFAADLELNEAGVLSITHQITNTGPGHLELGGLETTAPVGDTAVEVLDFSGRWNRERSPQRGPLLEGSRARESRRGRTGHDSPMLHALGTSGFSSSQGEIWAVHLAWSGDSVYRTDALPESRTVIGAGALLRQGEISLAQGEAFRSPAGVFIWSDSGLDGISRRLHRTLRSRPSHPHSPRPVTLNTWEAVYFAHDLKKLNQLAETAASIGVERFVLDDGWFQGRRSDNAGLGDWTVDPDVWPSGLQPLVEIVRNHGMQFGLWFEPEMVSPDSDLARTHPDWLLQPLENKTRTWRNQLVLDLARPEVFAYLLRSISTLVDEYRLDYIKWDQNRDLIEAVHDGRSQVHRHTEAVYALLDALRLRHPTLEIESCASGGARVDLGILQRTDRIWASDTNDPIERLDIQRWTELLLPPELIGSHIGPEIAHTTRRASSLGFRIATSFFAHAGLEWDITECTQEELNELRDAISAYRRLRSLVHSGEVAHLELGDDGLRVTAITAQDSSASIIRVARVGSSGRSFPKVLRVPALDPNANYHVRAVPELRFPRTLDVTRPPWLERGHVRLTGAALASLGLRLPQLGPGQAFLIEAHRVTEPTP